MAPNLGKACVISLSKILCFAWIRREDLWWGIYAEYASYLWGQNTCLLRGAMINLEKIKDWSSTHVLKHKSSMHSYAHNRATFHLFARFPWFFCTMWPHICHALHFSKYEVPHTSSIWLVKKTSCGNRITRKIDCNLKPYSNNILYSNGHKDIRDGKSGQRVVYSLC